MTKQHTKYIAGALLVGLMLPSLSFAADREMMVGAGAQLRAGASGTPHTIENFCTRLDGNIEKLEAKITEREGKLGEKRTERSTKVKEKLATRDTTRSDHRNTWDANRVTLYAKLDAKATTSVERAAVVEFKTAIDAAVTARRTAVDKVVADYRTALDKAVTDRQASVGAAISAFKTSRDAAIAQAKTDCGAGKTPSDVRVIFTASMKAAQDALRAAVKALENRKDTLTPLAAARNADVKKAVADFKTAVDAAKTKLKATYDVKANVK